MHPLLRPVEHDGQKVSSDDGQEQPPDEAVFAQGVRDYQQAHSLGGNCDAEATRARNALMARQVPRAFSLAAV